MPRELDSMMEGGYKSMGGATQPADDSSPSLMNANEEGDQKKPGLTRKGNVYVERGDDGTVRYYPVKHYDNGLRVSFPTEEEADAANNMSEEEVQRMQGTGQEQGQSLMQAPMMGRGNAPTVPGM